MKRAPLTPTVLRSLTSVGVALTPLGLASVSSAQPAGLVERKDVSSGTTDVAKEGFKTVEKPEGESKDATKLKLSAGGLLTSGNARTWALTSALDFRLRRGDNQLKSLAAVNVAASAADPEADYEKTVENYQALVRYDRFFNQIAAFASVTARRDEFQGLNLRLNLDPGLAYYFIDEKDVQLRAELGYDLQYDIRTQDAIDAALVEDGTVLDETETRHSARVFAGYNHAFSQAVSFDTSLEYIQALKGTENYRINWGAALTSQIVDRFSVATSVQVKYDHNPVPGVETTDVFAAFSLVYSLE